ncbi:reverse transcriptase domain-containing protein [Tanacetum coccineum]
MSKVLLLTTGNRLEGRLTLRLQTQMFPSRIQGLPPNTNGKRRQAQDSFPRSKRDTQEEDDETDFQNQEEKGKNTGWRIYTDGASSDNGSWAGLMIVSPKGMEFTYALKFEFTVTNNEAEYEVVKPGLRIAKEMKIEEITVFVDSQLVANQVNGSYEAKHHHIKQYLQITKELLKSF